MPTQGYGRQAGGRGGTAEHGEIFLGKSVLTKFVSLAWSRSEKNANNTTQLRAPPCHGVAVASAASLDFP
jgi:hypothetical protein